jgi:uncharacterized protein with FMN-binding domain
MRRRGPVKTSRALLAATSAGFVAVLSVHAVGPSGRKPLATPATSTTPTSSSTSPTTPTTFTNATRSAVGASEQFGYGTISVEVTVQGTHITAVSVANLQTLESFSQSLTNQAVPLLTSEALSAQSASIQGVSGASYTSAGFAQSLQSALSQLGI